MRSTILAITVLGLLATLFVFSGCGNLDSETPKASGQSNNVTVEVYNNEYHPSSVSLKTGGTITWKNTDQILYSVTSDGVFDTIIQIGGSWQYTFNQAGTFQIHDRMSAKPPVMTVTVK